MWESVHYEVNVVHSTIVSLLYPPGIDYIAAFFGCLYAGVIVVPACPPEPPTAR
jgi:acyl-CoA synthetase (AMP-forming)/AMP-acid ligase II